MDALKDESDDLLKEDGTVAEENEGVKLVVDKQISANDIRARILRLPKRFLICYKMMHIKLK